MRLLEYSRHFLLVSFGKFSFDKASEISTTAFTCKNTACKKFHHFSPSVIQNVLVGPNYVKIHDNNIMCKR